MNYFVRGDRFAVEVKIDASGARTLQPCDEMGNHLKFGSFKITPNGKEYGSSRYNAHWWYAVKAEDMPIIAAKIKSDEAAAIAERDAQTKKFEQEMAEIKRLLTPAFNQIMTVDAELGLYKMVAVDAQKERIVFLFRATFVPQHEYNPETKKMMDAYAVEVTSYYRAFEHDEVRPHVHNTVYAPEVFDALARVWRVCTY